MSGLSEFDVQHAALGWLNAAGYTRMRGPAIAPAQPAVKRVDYAQALLLGRLRAALEQLNSDIPPDALEEALRIRDDVGLFQAVRAALVKSAGVGSKPEEEPDHAIRQIVSPAIASEEVIDIFAAAGLKKPDISILSDEFLAEVRGLPQLTEEELAFYDALGVNHSAVKVLGDEALKTIGRELVEAIRRNVSIDWTVKESVRAWMRPAVKRILRCYGYPPDKQQKATLTVIEHAELSCAEWTGRESTYAA